MVETDKILQMPEINKETEVLKLFKMSKGYNWEIKLLNLDIKRLENLNNEMMRCFGGL